MNNSLLLLFESVLDIVLLVLGVILIFRARDNRSKLYWGIMSAFVGVFLFQDNISWVILFNTTDLTAMSCGLLVMKRMLKWYLLGTYVFIFPLVFLRSGYITPMKMLVLSLPVGATALTIGCYFLFNGRITELYSFQSIIHNTGRFDVKLRLFIFAITVVIPVVYFFIPVLCDLSTVKKKLTPAMWIYVISMILMLSYYIFFTVCLNNFIFYTYGGILVSFCIFFSILYLFNENPFFSATKTPQERETDKKALAGILYSTMDAYLKTHQPYIDPEYSLKGMACDLNAKETILVEAIKYGGFTGFRDYINYLRVEHFKKSAQLQRGKLVKELMHESGFTSRSSFYRIFVSYEQMSPAEYIEKLYLE